VFSVQCSVFSVQCSVFSVQCSVFSVQCSVFSVQCSVPRFRGTAPAVGSGVGLPGYARVIRTPHFGQVCPLHGCPAVCGAVAPHLGQTHWPPGPPASGPPMRPMPAPRPAPAPRPTPVPRALPPPTPPRPLPGPAPAGPVPSPLGIVVTSWLRPRPSVLGRRPRSFPAVHRPGSAVLLQRR